MSSSACGRRCLEYDINKMIHPNKCFALCTGTDLIVGHDWQKNACPKMRTAFDVPVIDFRTIIILVVIIFNLSAGILLAISMRILRMVRGTSDQSNLKGFTQLTSQTL